jgi:serine/threonine protein phosphatase PrpC
LTRLRHGAASHVGLVRQQNEDSFVAGGGVFAVCDGMGGARAGEVASEVACRFLMELTPGADSARLESTVSEANRAIFLKSVEDSSLAGMGTTLTALVRTGDGVLVAHVGDSRAYLWREGGLRQLTDDHSLVGELVRRGQLTPAQAAVHPHRSVITRALGTDGVVKPDIFPISLEAGDRLLICSDGLSGMVAEQDIARLLGTGDDPQSIAQSLVEAALEGGGEDGGASGGAGDAEDQVVRDRETPVFGPERRQESVQAKAGATGRLERARQWVGGPRRGVLILVMVLAVLLIIALAGLVLFNSTVYHVGTTEEGIVALYHGMPQTVLGWRMYRLVEVGNTSYASLEQHLKDRVDAHGLLSKEEGQQFVRGLAVQPVVQP